MDAIAERYVELALAEADCSKARALAIDETSRARGCQCVTIAVNAQRRAVIFVTESRKTAAIACSATTQGYACSRHRPVE